MNFHLFGATSSSGESFRLAVDANTPEHLFAYSRSNPSLLSVDFLDPASFHPGGEPGSAASWISFAPIWLFASFLENLYTHHPDRLVGLRSVVACSSSSAVTKRYSTNSFDRQLVEKLLLSEDKLLSVCQSLGFPATILRPTLIYGRVGQFSDKNLSRLLTLLRFLPLLPLPADTGLRQPIHSKQLAAVALYLSNKITASEMDSPHGEIISIGGDITLNYFDMLRALQMAQPDSDPARRCLLIPVSNRLFYFFASPFLLFSAKTFEAVLRMGANLSGFTPSHQILGTDILSFPVKSVD